MTRIRIPMGDLAEPQDDDCGEAWKAFDYAWLRWHALHRRLRSK